MIQKAFSKIMDKLGPYENKPHLAIAVSGGSDSMCLAILAKEWANSKGGKVSALIVDHGLRKSSKKECAKTKKELENRKIITRCFKWKLSKIPKNAVQEKAREFRYNIFEEWCFKKKIKNLLVAHHFEDQKETFIMRLNNNSDIYGLACMPKVLLKKEIRILRPMLDFNKKEIIKYLKQNKISWIEDKTNSSSIYYRNRVRKVLPKLQEKGLTDKKLKKILKRAQLERKIIESNANKWLVKNVEVKDLGYVSINFSNLKLLSKDNFVFIFSKIINIVSGSFHITKSKYLNNLYNKINSKENNKHTNIGGCHILFEKNKLYVSREILKRNREQKINFKFNKIIWDNRFEIKYKENNYFFLKKRLGKTLFIEQLAKNGWNEVIKKNRKIKKKLSVPNKIILSLPAIKNKENHVLYVPHLKYYSSMEDKNEFSNINFIFKPFIDISNKY